MALDGVTLQSSAKIRLGFASWFKFPSAGEQTESLRYSHAERIGLRPLYIKECQKRDFSIRRRFCINFFCHFIIRAGVRAARALLRQKSATEGRPLLLRECFKFGKMRSWKLLAGKRLGRKK